MFDEIHSKVFLQILNSLGNMDQAFKLKEGLFEFCLLLTQIELDNKELHFENVTLMFEGMTIDQSIAKEKNNREHYIKDLIHRGLVDEEEKSFLIFLKKKYYVLKFHEKPKFKNDIVKAVCEMSKKGKLDYHSEESKFLYDFYKYNFKEGTLGTTATPKLSSY